MNLVFLFNKFENFHFNLHIADSYLREDNSEVQTKYPHNLKPETH